MKKLVVTIMSAVLLICSTPFFAYASSSIPTVEWNLYISDEMASNDIFCDPINHRGNYEYQAYINNYKLYSNYYFKPQSIHRYVLYGYEMYSVNQSYYFGMRKYVYGVQYPHFVPASTHSFQWDFSANGEYLGNQAYFFIDGSVTGAEVSIQGSLETY